MFDFKEDVLYRKSISKKIYFTGMYVKGGMDAFPP